MKSNVCKIDQGTRDLGAILNECEKVAAYNNLSHKQALQMRLLCEEIDGMLPNVIDKFEGELWFDFEDGVCKVNLSIQIPKFNTEKKDELINIAKNKKNAAAVGIVGKIRDSIENFFLDESMKEALNTSNSFFPQSTGFSEGVDYSYLWSLEQYKAAVKPDEQSKEWDELEKSVIASVADDVIVSVKANQADIVIVKKFA